MNLGIFLPTARNGFIVSTTSPQFRPTWELNRDVAQRCEELGFGFALSMVKHQSFGGPSRFWADGLDSMSTMSALAPATNDIQLIASIPILAVHPAIAARQAATISEIAGGRFAVNIVTGWNKFEYETMNLWPGEAHYARRYDYATEYVQILKQMWTTGSCTFEGEFFELHEAECPVAPHDIAVVCAGISERGMRFTAECGDQNFVFGDVPSLRGMKATLSAEGEKAGRDIGTLALFAVFMAETDDEAQQRYQGYVDGMDVEALRNAGFGAALDAKGGATTGATAPERAMFLGQQPIIGSYETVARQLREIDDADVVEGIMLTFPEWLEDLERFGRHVKPLLPAATPHPAPRKD